MSLKTRIDGRAEDNNSFQIKNERGEVIAEIKLLDNFGATLEISTMADLYIEKPSGWNSKGK